MQCNRGSVFSGAFLIAGTTIGGGMLALPVLTSQAGFVPSLAIYILCWLFMAGTGLLFLETSTWIKGESNIISMATRTLGIGGKIFAWALYLFLFYCLTIAYMVGCGNIVVDIVGGAIPDWLGPIIFTLLFSPLILFPTLIVGRLNIFLMAGLALSFFGFVILGFSYVQAEPLMYRDWGYSMKILPIVFISFAYQGIIPTLNAYMDHDVKKIRKAILIGSFIPFIAYAIWQWLILGIIPLKGDHGLIQTIAEGQTAVHPLKYFIQNESIYVLGQTFAFFALVTSFLGVTLGLRDFLADGLSIKKEGMGQVWIYLMVFFVPLAIAVLNPHIFLSALDYAGGFGSALLLGLLPILMVWKGRYHLKLSTQPQLPGGRFLLAIMAIFVLCEIAGEVKQLFFR